VELGLRTTSDQTGAYRFRLPATPLTLLTLRASYPGKQAVEVLLRFNGRATDLRRDVQLPIRSLELADVEVNARRTGQNASNSAIVIDRSAIEQTQAYSLDDVLQLLPGKTIQNPNLQGAQNITLRATPLVTQGGTDNVAAYTRNNAFGTAIIVDGATWGNNGNLQAVDPGRTAEYNLRGSSGNGSTYASGDFTGSSLDLKQIPASNIESVEVIQGVASARYGDLTSGAVIVNRQAGRTPYRLSVRTQNGTVETSASKGVGLGEGKALNVTANYLYSNPEPSFPQKAYNRAALNSIYTNYFGASRRHRNTLALDAYTTLDGAKVDPDDRAGARETYAREQGGRVANRGTLNWQRPWSEFFNYQFGGSYSAQTSYHKLFLNRGVRQVADGMSTSTYEGSFAPAGYEAIRRIEGKPLNLYARFDNNVLVQTGAWSHTVGVGASITYDRNYGAGRLYNPLLPFDETQQTRGGLAERPYSFRSVPGMAQVGAFVEDQVVREWGPRKLIGNLGVRYDRQNGFSTLAPRLNVKFYLTEGVQLNAAYGLAAKAPGLIHRYPGLLYFDTPLLVNYTNNYRENLHLVHTEVINPANPNLRPARARTLELGLNLTRRRYAVSATGYYKRDLDGFNIVPQVLTLDLPQYRITSRPPNQLPVVITTGQTNRYTYSYGVTQNSLRTNNYGLELLLHLNKVPALQTDFDLSTAYGYSAYLTKGQKSYQTFTEAVATVRDIQLVERLTPNQVSESLISTGSATTHLSRLRLLVTVRGQVFWGRWSRVQNNEGYYQVTGFYRPNGEYVAVSPEDLTSGPYQMLRTALSADERSQAFTYGVLHLRLGKELGKFCRLSFFANNFLNLRPEGLIQEFGTGSSYVRYNQDPAFGSEVVFTF
jgi:hypothetical protein